MGCAEFLTVSVLMTAIQMQYRANAGKIGEEIASNIMTEGLGFRKSSFSPTVHGFDNIFVNNRGELVVCESKNTTSNPFTQLKSDGNGPNEMTDQWIKSTAEKLQDPNTAQCKGGPHNATIGAEISKMYESKVEIDRYLVHTDINSAEVNAYKLVGSDVTSRSSWKCVGTWDMDGRPK